MNKSINLTGFAVSDLEKKTAFYRDVEGSISLLETVQKA